MCVSIRISERQAQDPHRTLEGNEAVHGEYKVPGGKLVVVDLDVEDGVLRNVRVAGDFFLEPDEAILSINGALEGALPRRTRQAWRPGSRPRCRSRPSCSG